MTDGTDRQVLRARIDVVSSKAALAFDDVIAHAERVFSPRLLSRWVELGCLIATGSAVAAVKYFRESPALCEQIDPASLDPALDAALGLGREAPNVALEFLRQAPLLTRRLDAASLAQWARIGVDVVRQDYGTAIEYVKESAGMIGLIPLADFSVWADLGLRLMREDVAVKDYLALEYFRSSSDWLSGIAVPILRPLVLTLAARLAAANERPGSTQRPGQAAIEVLRYVRALLDSLPSLETQRAVLIQGTRMAEQAPGLTREFLRHAPEAVALMDGSVTRFMEWVDEGLAIATTHLERGEAYFALQSKQATEVAQRLSRGIFLRDVRSALTFYAEALSGRSIEIRPGHGASSAATRTGGLITLPEKITVYSTPEDNFRFYKVLTLHEAGHLEFGTYDPLPQAVLHWFGETSADEDGRGDAPLRSLLDRFPDPGLAQNLWTIVEEARIDFLLRHEYPGMRAEIDRVLFEQLRGRPKIETLSRRSAILEALLQLSVADIADIPLPVLDVVAHGYELIKGVRKAGATIEDVTRIVIDLYALVSEGLAEPAPISTEPQPEPLPPSEFDQLAMGHAPIESFAFRDTLTPPPFRVEQHGGVPSEQRPPSFRSEDDRPREEMAPVARASEGFGDETIAGSPTHDGIWYDEWDAGADAYRSHWCRVSERPADEGLPDEVEAILTRYRGMIASLRRSFEVIRPEAFRKQRRQTEGEEIDLDAAIASVAEQRCGLTPSDHVYIRREKRLRDVSAAFLIDTSGSTSRQLTFEGRSTRVIDVEREGLVLLTEALDALGDEFALFAFSGQSRQGVECRVIKDFEQPAGPAMFHRIGGLKPSGQNRDGAAIRHVTHRLRQRPAAVKLLIVLSDGKPLDDEYVGGYAIADTKVALREARARGIRPFCVTVDDAASEYIGELYGETDYAIIRHVAALPSLLPRLYKRLTT